MKNKLKEDCGEMTNYMFFQNLKTMKHAIDEILSMDATELDEIITQHNWALDHITKAADDVEEVYHFLEDGAGMEDMENDSMGDYDEFDNDYYDEDDIYNGDSDEDPYNELGY